MRISAIDPIQPAWQRTLLVCFRPFNLGKWFALGFCAWLAMLGEAGTMNFQFGGGGGNGPGGSNAAEIRHFLHHYLPWVIAGAIILVLLGLAIGILVMWLRARGAFMFIDGVVFNRGLVAQPWREYRREGQSLFRLHVVLALIVLSAFMLAAGLALLLAWPDIAARKWGMLAVLAIIVGGVLFLMLMVIVLEVFVVPLMYLRRATAGPAWHEIRTQMLPGNLRSIFLFALMSLVLGMGSGIALMLVGLMTCCIGCCLLMLPYLSMVFSLPVLVFMKSYGLYFFQQFGPEYQIVPADLPMAPGFPVIPLPPQ